MTEATTSTVTARVGIRRRIDKAVLRWQGRLDADWADRFVPWSATALLFALLVALSLARARSLDGGAELGEFTQAAWLVARGAAPFVTITDTHLLAEQAAFVFYPIAWSTRVLPIIPTLLVVQSAVLALGVIPLWWLARWVAKLRVGAATVLVVAYMLYPALHDLNLADFHPEVVALPALLAAALFGLTDRWRAYAVAVAVILLCRADLGLAVAALGIVLAVEGRRRAGAWSMAVGIGWTLLAVLVVQPHFGDGVFIHADAFTTYGDTPWAIFGSILTSPVQVLGDLTSEQNFDVAVVLLAPVAFLPVLAPRFLLPILPLEALYLLADTPTGEATRPEHTIAITAFIFLATTFALARIGRQSVSRVSVDRRILGALLFASAVFFVRDAASSPYRHPWDWGGRDAVDAARLEAADLVGPFAPVRASSSLLPLLGEREGVYLLDTDGNPHVRRAAEDAYAIVFDAEAASDWDDEARRRFHGGLERSGFERISTDEGVWVYVRALTPPDHLRVGVGSVAAPPVGDPNGG